MGWYCEQFQQQVDGRLYASGSSQRLVIRALSNLAGSQLLNGVEISEKFIHVVSLCWQGKLCRLHRVQTVLLDCKYSRLSVSSYRTFSITWPAFLIIYRNKRRKFQLPEDFLVTPTRPRFHCFGTPMWSPRRQVKTLLSEWVISAEFLIGCQAFLFSVSIQRVGNENLRVHLPYPANLLVGLKKVGNAEAAENVSPSSPYPAKAITQA